MRKRTGTRFVPMTISVKPEMINDIENELKPKESRSQWVADAIRKKLDGETTFNVMRDGSAMHMFNAFKVKMEREGVRIEMMFLEIIEKNIKDAMESKASVDEH